MGKIETKHNITIVNEDYNPDKKRNVLIVLDNMIVDRLIIKN